MLKKAVAAVKGNEAKALDMFNKGEGGFKDRDLYPFCFNLSDGIFVAAIKQLLGTDVRTLKGPTGEAYGLELYAAAQNPEDQNHRGRLHVSKARAATRRRFRR